MEKKKWIITIEETISQDFEIEAEDIKKAMELAREKYKDGEFVVEPSTPTAVLIHAKTKDGEEETATLGNISDSDGIGRKATRVISIRHIGSGIELALIKNRYGRDNQKIIYKWNADTSEFVYIPQLDDEVITPTVKQEQMGAIF